MKSVIIICVLIFSACLFSITILINKQNDWTVSGHGDGAIIYRKSTGESYTVNGGDWHQLLYVSQGAAGRFDGVTPAQFHEKVSNYMRSALKSSE